MRIHSLPSPQGLRVTAVPMSNSKAVRVGGTSKP
jgi:hypothetical protein